MGGDPVSVIHDIRALLDIGRDRKNPREEYLGEFYCPGPRTLLSPLLPTRTLTLPFPPSDVYVFGVGPLVNQDNINALASKKDKEQHVFKVRDMEDLENVFFQMIGRKISPRVLLPKPWQSGRPFSFLLSTLESLFPGTVHFLILESQNCI